MLTPRDAAKCIGVSYITLMRYIHTGSLKAINYNAKGKRPTWRISEEEIRRFLDGKIVDNGEGTTARRTDTNV